MDNYLPLLEHVPIFSGLSRDEIAALCRAFSCHSAYYEKGSVIWHRDERVSSAGIVLRGCVQAERNGSDGTLRIVARHSAGALFGDVLMSSQLQRSPVDIVTAEDSEVLFLPLVRIMEDLNVECREALVRFRLNLLAEISNKYWALYRRLNYLSAGNMRARIAQYLLQIRAERKSDSFVLPLTRETLAAELGVNRSALCRELGRMQREGLLAVRRTSFTILDAAALEQLCG